MSTEQWRPLVSSIWPTGQVENVLAVMECESSGNPNAHALTDREDSRGLMQINVRAHPDAGNMYDPEANLRYAYQLWRAEGWEPWSCAGGIGRIGQNGAQASASPMLIGLGAIMLFLVLSG